MQSSEQTVWDLFNYNRDYHSVMLVMQHLQHTGMVISENVAAVDDKAVFALVLHVSVSGGTRRDSVNDAL